MGFTINNGVLEEYTEEPGITEVIIPEGVTSIGESAFEGCDSLTSITIPEGVTSIGERAFYRCINLTSITIPESVTSIGESAFYNCRSLTNLTIPEGVTSIGSLAFYNCSSLTSITIPEGVTSIGNWAFKDCSSLTSITIPNSVIRIGDHAFEGCESLTNLTIPEGVTGIGEMAFYDCRSLTSITIPDSVISIGWRAFQGCSSLTSLIVPEGVTSIGANAFLGCRSLTNIVAPDRFTNVIIRDGVTAIKEKMFLGNNILTSIKIPASVRSIGNEAFSGCNRLTDINIPEGVTSIGESAFEDCESLTNLTIPEGVTSIGRWAFYNCRSLTSLTIPEGVTSIGERAFEGCDSLTSITIPEGVTSIGKGAFQGCSSLTDLVLPITITTIGKDVFAGCSSLKEVVNMVSLVRNGCKVEVSTLTWLLGNLWKSPEHLKETAEVYLALNVKAVNNICEAGLLADCPGSADVMLGLIESFKDNSPALKKIANFALICGNQLPREKLLAIYEGLKTVGAKPAVKLLEKAVQNEEGPKLEGATGNPIEAICLERFNQPILDRGLKNYGIRSELFTGVRYKGSETLAPAYVLQCVIVPYMQKLKVLPKKISSYRSDFIKVERDAQIDEIADALEREDLQQLLERLITEYDPIDYPWLLLPYCRYGSGKQMNALASRGEKWENWYEYLAKGRTRIMILRGAMLLNESREAMFLMDKWGLLDELARRMNTTADVLRYTVLTEFDLDVDGSKHYDLGNAVIAASIASDLSVSLVNENSGKEVKSLPKKGADPEKYEAASKDFTDLKKNIKNAVKSIVNKLKEDFVSGSEINTSDWKAFYVNNYVLKRIASLLVWQWQHEKTARRFMLTMDGSFIDCAGQPVEVRDEGTICLAHPIEIPAEELECWKDLLTQKQIAQPFVQIFEPVSTLDPAEAAARYTGIELPMFLLRGLSKEGIEVDLDSTEPIEIGIHGRAIEANASIVDFGTRNSFAFTERSISFDAIVKLEDVSIIGTPRAVNHEIYAMDKALIENRVRNGNIAAVQTFSSAITAKTIQHLIDVSIEAQQMECTAWLLNYKNEHFPIAWEDLEL